MIQLSPTKDYKLIDEIMTNRDLFEASMPDGDFKLLKEGKWSSENGDWIYLHVTKDETSVGIIRLKFVTPVMVEFHWHLLPQHWGTGVSNEANEALEAYVQNTLHVNKLMSYIPSSCKHTLKAAGRAGYEIEGVLCKGEYWRGQVVDLVIIAKFLGDKKYG